ncbi:MAG TPA: DUF3343 domain-containing protein [Synergistales bacterium]|nr:DUF3343 domain-containing protein [Synergistales bacterium]
MVFAYALFKTATDGMILHRRLRELGVKDDICPTPRHLADSCGISLRFDAIAAGAVREEAGRLGIPIELVVQRP